MKLNTQIKDQSAHFAVGFVIVAIAIAGGFWGCVIAGGLVGLMRELGEAGTPLTFSKAKAQLAKTDAPLDLAFWTLGGAFAGGLLL
jgi:hypothetical protein